MYCYPEKLHNTGKALQDSHIADAELNPSKNYSMQECKKTGSHEIMPVKIT
jgi:hypothetical protein